MERTKWGFPKGRRNYQEKDLDAAIREWEEETEHHKHQIESFLIYYLTKKYLQVLIINRININIILLYFW